MSRLNYIQLRKMYDVPAQVYYIEIYKQYTEQGFLQLCEKVRYHCSKHNVSYLLAFSTTDSKTAKPKHQRTGKRGRPRKIIDGKKVDGHCHNLFISDDKQKSCRQTILKIANSINKKEQRKVTKINSISNGADVHDFTGYILRQSDILRAGGSFDFKEFYNNGI